MKTNIDELPRREREVFETVYSLKEATAAEVQAMLPEAPTYSAVRTMLARLEAKGVLKHREDGQRYLYSVATTRARTRESALRRVVRTFFDDSPARAATALLGMSTSTLTDDDIRELEAIVERAKKEKR
jgi:predicted transcriptional regulator